MSYTTEQLISYLEGYVSKCMNYQKQLIKQRDKQLGEHQRPDEEIYDKFGKSTVRLEFRLKASARNATLRETQV